MFYRNDSHRSCKKRKASRKFRWRKTQSYRSTRYLESFLKTKIVIKSWIHYLSIKYNCSKNVLIWWQNRLKESTLICIFLFCYLRLWSWKRMLCLLCWDFCLKYWPWQESERPDRLRGKLWTKESPGRHSCDQRTSRRADETKTEGKLNQWNV